jgi:hypothetical protein
MNSTKVTRCPSEETLCGFADGTLVEGRAEVESHLAECEECFSVVSELAQEVRVLEGAQLISTPVELERRVQGREIARAKEGARAGFFERLGKILLTYRMAGALATVSLVAIVALWAGEAGRHPGQAPSGVREMRPGGPDAPLLIEPKGTILATDRVVFRWEPCAPGSRYVITVVDADSGRVVAREAASSPEYALEIGRLAGTGGRHFEWMVQCTLEDGRVATSPAVPFELGQIQDSE